MATWYYSDESERICFLAKENRVTELERWAGLNECIQQHA